MSEVEIVTHEIELDTKKCRAYGICVGLAPDHFAMPPGQPRVTVTKRAVTKDEYEEVEEAVEECPAQALKMISWEESR